MANDKWQMTNGKRKMNKGLLAWQMANEKWQMENLPEPKGLIYG
jgi:hypothetical protein